MIKCKEKNCNNEKAQGRSRCFSCYGKARRSGTSIHNYTSPSNLKMLFIDIETQPNLGYFWDIFNTNVGISQIEEAVEMMCFAAKFYGNDEVLFFHGRDNRQQMIQAAWDLLNEADVVVHFYGSNFDIPHLNREFLLNGFPPPRPFKQIDLKKQVAKRFKFTSNKLQFISTQLGLEGKESTDFDLWKDCMHGDLAAWDRMESYNRQDVLLLEDVYEILLPWIENHPSRLLYTEEQGCPTCGAGKLEDAGYAYTRVSKFRQYNCSNCKAYFRDSRRIEGVSIQESAL